MKNVVKLGPVEMYEHEAAAAYAAGKYLVTYKTVYQIHFSQAQGWHYATPVYSSTVPLAKRGRFHLLTGKEINTLIGHDLLN